MKTKAHLQLEHEALPIDGVPSYHPGSSPSSSALFGVTVLGDAEDILAIIRTAVLLGKTFKAEVSVDVFGNNLARIESGEILSHIDVLNLLASIQGKLSESANSEFALEATWTNASFISAGTISLSVYGAGSEPKKSVVAR